MLGYDVFKLMSDGHPFWVGSVEDLDHARRLVQTLGLDVHTNAYFVRDARTGVRVPLVNTVASAKSDSAARSRF